MFQRISNAYTCGCGFGAILLIPAVASAQINTNAWIGPMFVQINGVLQAAIPVLLSGALLLFIWGAIRYFVAGAGEEANRTEGRMFMVYALIGLVLLVAVWGIVNLLLIILGVGPQAAPPLPSLS